MSPTLVDTQGITLPFLSLPLSKSYPLSRFKKRTKTNTVKRSHPERAPKKLTLRNNVTAIPTREARQLAYFSQQNPTVAQKVELAAAEYSKKLNTKGKLTASALGPPSLNHIMTDDVVFEHVCLHLILFYFLSPH